MKTYLFGTPFSERVKLCPEIAEWHPASGHPGGWRVLREREGGIEELTGRSGKLLLFKSIETANRRISELPK